MCVYINRFDREIEINKACVYINDVKEVLTAELTNQISKQWLRTVHVVAL